MFLVSFGSNGGSVGTFLDLVALFWVAGAAFLLRLGFGVLSFSIGFFIFFFFGDVFFFVVFCAALGLPFFFAFPFDFFTVGLDATWAGFGADGFSSIFVLRFSLKIKREQKKKNEND